MEELNLGDTIALLQVFKWQHDATKELEAEAAKEVRSELMKSILETIDLLEVPQLVPDLHEH